METRICMRSVVCLATNMLDLTVRSSHGVAMGSPTTEDIRYTLTYKQVCKYDIMHSCYNYYINQDPVCLSVRLSVTDVTSLPQRVLWERGYNVYRNAYAGNESPKTVDAGQLYRAIATVTGGLRRCNSRH